MTDTTGSESVEQAGEVGTLRPVERGDALVGVAADHVEAPACSLFTQVGFLLCDAHDLVVGGAAGQTAVERRCVRACGHRVLLSSRARVRHSNATTSHTIVEAIEHYLRHGDPA